MASLVISIKHMGLKSPFCYLISLAPAADDFHGKSWSPFFSSNWWSTSTFGWKTYWVFIRSDWFCPSRQCSSHQFRFITVNVFIYHQWWWVLNEDGLGRVSINASASSRSSMPCSTKTKSNFTYLTRDSILGQNFWLVDQ